MKDNLTRNSAFGQQSKSHQDNLSRDNLSPESKQWNKGGAAVINTSAKSPIQQMTEGHHSKGEPNASASLPDFSTKLTTTGNLPDNIKSPMERTFGHSFADVKVHPNSSSATSLGALAYTQGSNIHFAPGQFQPNIQKGKELLGHELTHVVQQREGRVKTPAQAKSKSGMSINDDPALEKEADMMGEKAAKGDKTSFVAQKKATSSTDILQLKTKHRKDYPWTGVVTKDAELWVGPAKASGKTGDLKKGSKVDVTNELFDCFGVIPKGSKTKGYAHQDSIDDPTSHYLDTDMMGNEMKWQPSSPGVIDSGGIYHEFGKNNFAKWALSPAEGAIPTIDKSSTINCWEVVLYAAYKAGLLTWAQIHASYTKKVPASTVTKLLDPDPTVQAQGEKEVGKFVDQVLISLMTDGSKKPWDYSKPHLTQPSRGDVVLFDGAAHVSLATGDGDKIYTFWPPPNTPFTAGGTVDKIKTSTIKELYDWMKTNFGKAPVVTYYSPSW